VAFDPPEKLFSRNDIDQHQVGVPAFARICKGLHITDPATGYYPMTLDQAYEQVVKHHD
jgi:energy-coupling factor transport system ATP-binding protein